MRQLRMLDLYCGFSGASAAMRERGWWVLGVDVEARVRPSVVADVCHLPFQPFPVDLLWASPPCTYYSRYDQRGLYPREPVPDHTLYRVTRRIVEEWQPTYYVVENVRGAVRFWGRADFHFGSQYLWTNLPLMAQPVFPRGLKVNLCSGRDPLCSAKRGYMPRAISDVVADAVEYLTEAS